MTDLKRTIITGRAISVRGNDIDTDRIIPARYLRCVVFDGLGEHAFEDDRRYLAEKGQTHALDNKAYAGAEILFVNKNFGCGSSREHAPQALMRWGKGIKAIVGESFAEIFFGNCVALGIPCVTVDEKTAQALMNANEADPSASVTVDLVKKIVFIGKQIFPMTISDGPRKQFLEGRWDSTAELLESKAAIAATASNLPYFNNWK